MPINLAVNNTAPMTMNISETLITGLIPGTVQVLVQQPNGTEAEAFVLSAVSEGALSLFHATHVRASDTNK